MTPLEFEIVRLTARVQCDLLKLDELNDAGSLEDEDFKGPHQTAAELTDKLKTFMTFGQTIEEAGLKGNAHV